MPSHSVVALFPLNLEGGGGVKNLELFCLRLVQSSRVCEKDTCICIVGPELRRRVRPATRSARLEGGTGGYIGGQGGEWHTRIPVCVICRASHTGHYTGHTAGERA